MRFLSFFCFNPVLADNENHVKDESPKPCQAPVATQEQMWKSPQPAQQRNHIPSFREFFLTTASRVQFIIT